MNQVNNLKINDGKLIGQYNTNKKYIIDASDILNDTYYYIQSGRLLVTESMIPSSVTFTGYNKLACRGSGDSSYDYLYNYVKYYDTSYHEVENAGYDDVISYINAKGFCFATGNQVNTGTLYHELVSGFFCPKQSNNYRKSGYFKISTARNDLKVRSVVITSADYGEYWSNYSDYAMPQYMIAYCEDSGTTHKIHWHKSASVEDKSNQGDSSKVYFMAYLTN